MRVLLLLVIISVLTCVCQAQDYVMKSSTRNGIIYLRWAPTNYKAWRLGIEYGYIVERYTILRDSVFPDDFSRKVLTQQPIMLANLEDWEANSDNDDMVAMAAQCIFDTLEVPHTAVDIYRHHTAKQQRFSLALYAADVSPLVADMSALFYQDKSADEREKYLYMVHVAAPDSLATDTAYTFIGSAHDTELPRIQKPEIHRGDKSLSIVWDVRHLDRFYTAYMVERSADGGRTYKSASDVPSIQFFREDNNPNCLSYTDSIPDNNTEYFYRVYGITCFGEHSEPSEAVGAKGMNMLTSAPELTEKKVIDNSKVQLGWVVTESNSDAIDGFRIYRRRGPKEHFRLVKEINDASARQYTDMMPDITNYYRISAFNQHQELITPYESYVQLTDSFPPAPPVKLSGTVDSVGVVSLTWQHNTESDLDGYRVYSNNTLQGEYSLQTPSILKNNAFKQTINLNTLTHTIYYHVRAVDVRGNTSKPSEVLTLERPDTIPPTTPRLEKPRGINGQAHLRWTRSFSDDVKAYLVLRRSSDGQVTVIDTIPSVTHGDEMDYIDASVQYSVAYDYGIEALDRSGNHSRNTVWRRLEMRAPASFAPKLNISSSLGENILTIKLPKDVTGKTATHLIVYRKVDDGAISAYDKVDMTQTYLDKNININHKYSYSVRLIFSDGSESGMSEIITPQR